MEVRLSCSIAQGLKYIKRTYFGVLEHINRAYFWLFEAAGSCTNVEWQP